jgi:hypothetical protein
VEIWFSKIQRAVISRGIFSSTSDLSRKLIRYIKQYNKTATPFAGDLRMLLIALNPSLNEPLTQCTRIRRQCCRMFGIAAPPQNSESCGACVAGAIKPALTPPLVDEQPTAAKSATLNTAASKAARPISLKNRPEQQSLSVLAVLQGALFYLDLCSYSFCLFIDFWMGA